MHSEDGDGVEMHPLVKGKVSLDDMDDTPRQSVDVDIPVIEGSTVPPRSERWTKLFVLALACTFSVGSHYSQDCIGPLKDIFKDQLNLSDSQMSLVLGSDLVTNTIVPIVAGVLVAKFGILGCSLFATGVLFMGQAINLIAVFLGNVPGMIFGLCLFGYDLSACACIDNTALESVL